MLCVRPSREKTSRKTKKIIKAYRPNDTRGVS